MNKNTLLFNFYYDLYNVKLSLSKGIRRIFIACLMLEVAIYNEFGFF